LRQIGTTSTAGSLVASTTWLQAIQNSAIRNGLTGTSCTVSGTSPNDTDTCTVTGSTVTITVTVGEFSGSTFTPSSSTSGGASDVPNSVKVTLGDTVKYFFSTASQSTKRSSVADRGQPEAWFK